ncbi:hypothetical protein LTR85_008686 [Meristemomyces frigidus]|nr:hypothetical protein LTR85_008686 [Meristemomyces frigidus]
MAGPSPIVNLVSSPASTQSKPPPSSHRLPTVSASEALQELQSHGPDSELSGVEALDTLLHNGTATTSAGFEHGKVTEIWGPSGAGKTGLMLQTAVNALMRRQHVVWVEADTPMNGPRLESALDHALAPASLAASISNDTQPLLNAFHHTTAPTLSHLLALTLHPRPNFPPEGTSLLVIDGLNTLIDLNYPRFPFAGLSKTEQQKWQTGRRYAVLGSLISALNKLAVLNNIAVLVTTGCASRMRSDSGLGSALAPGVGGGEWDAGVWTRLVVFRDFGGRLIGLQKCQGRSLISREEVGEVGRVVGVEISEHGTLRERMAKKGIEQALPLTARSPAKPRKRTYDEVADSDGEDADEYGWAERDEDALATGGLEDQEENGVAGDIPQP